MVKRDSCAPNKAVSTEKPDSEDRSDNERLGLRQTDATQAIRRDPAEPECCQDAEGVSIFLGQIQSRALSDRRKSVLKSRP